MRRVVFALVLLAALGWNGVALAQSTPAEGCAPVSVGDGTGVFFLVLGEQCTIDVANGYTIAADLERDDTRQELLVLVQPNADDETKLIALVLAAEVRAGSVDGNTWHAAPTPARPRSPVGEPMHPEGQPVGDAPHDVNPDVPPSEVPPGEGPPPSGG